MQPNAEISEDKHTRLTTSQISIRTRDLFWWLASVCILCELGFVLLDGFINYARWIDLGPVRRLCNIAREDSLASWFGTTQTFLLGMTAWLVVLFGRQKQASTSWTAAWVLLAAFFTYMAVDDGAEIHERMGSVFKAIQENRESVQGEPTLGARLLEIFPSYPWQVLFLPVFGCVGGGLLVFLWRECKGDSLRCLIPLGLACFVVAVGLDFVEGLDKHHPWNVHTWIRETYGLRKYTVRHFSKSIEESMEMVGTTLLWLVVLKHFVRAAHNTEIRFVPPPPTCDEHRT